MSKDLNISNPNNFTFDENYAAAHEDQNKLEEQNQDNPNTNQESQDEINEHANSEIILESQSHLINALNSIPSNNNQTGKNLSQNSQIPINNSNIKNEDITKLVDMIKNNSFQNSNNSQKNGIIPKIKELLLGKYVKILNSQNQHQNKDGEQKRNLENLLYNIDNNSNNSLNDELNEHLKSIINNTNQIIEANTLLSLVLLISNEGQERVLAELKKSNEEQQKFNQMIKNSLDEQKIVNSTMMNSINESLKYLINAKNENEMKKNENSGGQNSEEKK